MAYPKVRTQRAGRRRVSLAGADRGRTTQTIRANIKKEKLRQLSKEGVSFAEALEIIGGSERSLRDFLYRNEGSKLWPIK